MEATGKPANSQLYEEVKNYVYNKMPLNSLYRSAYINRLYKQYGGTFNNENNENNIKKWFKEDWINLNDYVRGKITKCGDGDPMAQYGEYKLCRPRKIAERIPKKQIKLMIKEKTKIGKSPLHTSEVLGTKKYNIKKIGKNL